MSFNKAYLMRVKKETFKIIESQSFEFINLGMPLYFLLEFMLQDISVITWILIFVYLFFKLEGMIIFQSLTMHRHLFDFD